MARRQRLPSWVEDEPTPKVVKPLRYRIDKTAEEADHLDQLLAELESQASTIESGDYWDLYDILKGRQEALAKRTDRLKAKPKVVIDSSYSDVVVTHKDRIRWAIKDYGHYVPSLSFKGWLAVFVGLWFISKNL